jgi:zinc protease
VSSQRPLRRNSELPEPGPIRPFELPPVHVDRLDAGLRVRAMQRGEMPLVSGCLLLDAGEATVPTGQAGLAVMAGDCLTGGTRRRSGAELDQALESLGVSLRVSTGWDAATLSFTCIAERLDQVLEILTEVVREPAFPPTEVDRVRAQRMAAIRQRRMNPGPLADDELDRVLFPREHPYHRPLSGEEDTLATLGREDAAGFVESRYRADGAGFALVGDLSSDQVEACVRRHLGDWSGGAAPRPPIPDAEPPAERPVVMVDLPGAVQSEIRVGLPGPSRGSDDEAALQVGNTILGGAFTSRLNLNLRERHGFTYGVRSRFAMRRAGGSFVISTSVQTEVTAAALSEAMKEFEGFLADGPAQEEVDQARDYLAGVFPLRMETGGQLAARLAELLIFDLPHDYHHGYRERIRRVTPGATHEAMSRYLDASRAPIVVVGDAERIAGDLDGLGLGALEVKSSDG